MDNLQKISDTKFSRPQPDEVVDVEATIRLRENALIRLQNVQEEIAQYDADLNQGKKVGIEYAAPDAEEAEIALG